MGGGGGEPAGPSPPVEGLARGPAVGVWANPPTHPGLWVEHISDPMGVGRSTGHSVGINGYVCGTSKERMPETKSGLLTRLLELFPAVWMFQLWIIKYPLTAEGVGSHRLGPDESGIGSG